MDPRALNDKLRKEILAGLVGTDRERFLTELEARENLTSSVEKGTTLRCSCGLVMLRGSFYEHLRETKHEERQVREKAETCSCGLTVSPTNLREHQIETGHTLLSGQVKQGRKRQSLRGKRPAGIRPALNFQFNNPADITEQ